MTADVNLPNKDVFLSIGSNIDPIRNVPLAIEKIAELGQIISVAGMYWNPAIGSLPQPDYLNTAVLLETAYEPLELKSHLKAIEYKLGRKRRSSRNSARPIDIDIVLFGSRFINTPELTIPDPNLMTFAHIAVPIAELYPEYLHPQCCKPLSAIADHVIIPDRFVRMEDGEIPVKYERR
ncbi:2-amino-4-hydroxy-6-hydroxymethyldihydropteridine diphosphokinase [bacterium]|nr:2-amino-4-hydroxy-6-hydroxymethyldihydropteridine diphosphokinase [candidate division CSSED10-310 bacterium]